MMPSQRHVTLLFLSLKLLAFLGLVNGFTLGQPRSKSACENELGGRGRNQAASITLHTRQSRDLEVHYRGTWDDLKKLSKDGKFMPTNENIKSNQAYSLDGHIRQVKADGKTASLASNYVSTSSEWKVARKFASSDLPVGEEAYIYTIKSTPNAVDVVESYRAAGKPLTDKYIGEKEFAYLGGIRQDQIMEVTKVTMEKNGQIKVWPTEKVSTYNHKYDLLSGGGAQPGLLKPAEGTSFTVEAEKFLNNEANTWVRNNIDKEYAVITKPKPRGPPAEAKPGVPESSKGKKKKPAGSADPKGIKRPNKLEKPAKGGNTGGLGPGKPPSQLASNPGVAQDDLIKKSDKIAKKEFGALSKKFGVEAIDGPFGKLGLADLYQKFTTLSLPSKLKTGTIAAASVIGLPLYAKQVYDVFFEDSTALNRTAVVASIIPFASCALKAAAEVEAGRPAPEVSMGICLFADSLMLTPAWPVGIALHLLLPWIDTILSDWTSSLSFEAHQRKRNDLWEQHVAFREQYIKSDNFTRVVETAFDIEAAALIYAASVATGALRAGQEMVAKVLNKVPTQELTKVPTKELTKYAITPSSSSPQPAAPDETIELKLCEDLTTRREKLRTDYLAAMSLDKEEEAVTKAYLKEWTASMAKAGAFMSGGFQVLTTVKETEEQLLKSRPESKNSLAYTEALESRVNALLGSKFDKTPCK